MKAARKIFAVITAIISFCALSISGQGSFQNLNFETESIPPGTQPSANVSIPGWTSSTGGVAYDDGSIGGQVVGLFDSKSVYNFTPLQGNYSVILFAGPDGGAADATAIGQTGLVPAGTQSILMDIAFPFGNSASMPFTVTLGGQEISMSPVQAMANYTVYGGNISAGAAGNVEQLIITEYPPAPPTTPPSSMALDDIIFSPNSVPEPAAWTLLLCGAGLLGVMRQFRKP